MPQSRAADGNPAYWREREERIRWFLTHPEGMASGDVIRRSQYFLRGKQLWTKPPELRPKKGLDRALMAEWKDGTLYVYNKSAPLSKQTLELAKELGIEVANAH